jgi:hypothetical protein
MLITSSVERDERMFTYGEMDMEEAILPHLNVLFQYSTVTTDENHEKAQLRQGIEPILSGVSSDLTWAVIQRPNYWPKKKGSPEGDYEDYCLLEYDVVWSGKSLATFRGNVLTTYSQENRHQVHSKRR